MVKHTQVTVEQARQVLGKSGKKYTDLQIQNIIASFQYVAKVWLDQYERETLGKTVNELLTAKEGGRVR